MKSVSEALIQTKTWKRTLYSRIKALFQKRHHVPSMRLSCTSWTSLFHRTACNFSCGCLPQVFLGLLFFNHKICPLSRTHFVAAQACTHWCIITHRVEHWHSNVCKTARLEPDWGQKMHADVMNAGNYRVRAEMGSRILFTVALNSSSFYPLCCLQDV